MLRSFKLTWRVDSNFSGRPEGNPPSNHPRVSHAWIRLAGVSVPGEHLSAKGMYMAHGHEKSITIIVNGRPKPVTKEELSFAEIVALADNIQTGADIEITVTYSRGEDKKPKGTLVAGDTVKVKDGMIFNVTATNRS